MLAPGEGLTRRGGLVFAATPASDFICGTLQVAAGMNMHVFTTGRGTPYNLSPVPVVKVINGSDLARRWHDLGWMLFRLLLEAGSGQRKTCAERLKLANSLVLFNPASVT